MPVGVFPFIKMNRYLRSEPVRYGWQILLAALFLLLTLGAARGATLVQDFYLPMPEAQIYQANQSIIAGAGQTNFSTFSIVVTGDGTQIFYDQWEDGYEVNLATPSQPTTLVWGDGNNANGICPGFANDPTGDSGGNGCYLDEQCAIAPKSRPNSLGRARSRGGNQGVGNFPSCLADSDWAGVCWCGGRAVHTGLRDELHQPGGARLGEQSIPLRRHVCNGGPE